MRYQLRLQFRKSGSLIAVLLRLFIGAGCLVVKQFTHSPMRCDKMGLVRQDALEWQLKLLSNHDKANVSEGCFHFRRNMLGRLVIHPRL